MISPTFWEFHPAVHLQDCFPGDPLLLPILREWASYPELQKEIVALLNPTWDPNQTETIRQTVAGLQRAGLSRENEHTLRLKLLLPMTWEESIDALAARPVPVQ